MKLNPSSQYSTISFYLSITFDRKASYHWLCVPELSSAWSFFHVKLCNWDTSHSQHWSKCCCGVHHRWCANLCGNMHDHNLHIRREFYWHCNAQAIANDWLRYCTLGHYCAVAGGCLENGHEGFQKATRWSNSKKDKSHMSACTELQNNFKWQSVCYFHIKCKEKIKTTLVCKKSQLDAPEATKINYINFNKLWKKKW